MWFLRDLWVGGYWRNEMCLSQKLYLWGESCLWQELVTVFFVWGKTREKKMCCCFSRQLSTSGTVCGTDGTSYNSECDLRNAACQQQKFIVIASKGHCGKWGLCFYKSNGAGLCILCMLKLNFISVPSISFKFFGKFAFSVLEKFFKSVSLRCTFKFF